MIKNIYLVLGGEDAKKRPRTNKLLEVLQQTQHPSWSEIKIILSGKALFNFDSKLIEAEEMYDFLIKSNVPGSSIKLEKEGMDFIGDLMFSYYEIEKIVLEEQGKTVEPSVHPKITIHFINEKFYMKRSKEFFLRFFKNIYGINPNIKFNFIEAKNSEAKPFFSEIKIKSLVKKIISGKLVSAGIQLVTEDRMIRENVLLSLAKFDAEMYGLKTIEEYKKYLCLLPEYQKLFLKNSNYIPSKCFYMIAINGLKENEKF